MLTPHNKRQKGLTLIEMMVAMVLGIFVTAVIITVFSTNVRSSTENIKMIRLNQELRGVMTMMVDELKRTGYSADPTNADFMNDFDPTTPGCVRYSYDEDNSSTQEADERFGFELSGNTIIWAKNYTNTDCSGTASTTSLTDPNLASITVLDFDYSGSVNTGGVSGSGTPNALTTTTGVSVYDVTITLTGTTDLPHSSDANDPRRTIIETVRIRNEDPKD